MTLAEVRFNIDPKTGAWVLLDADQTPRAPYVSFERRPVATGETYRVRHAGGHLTDEAREFPAGQTHKIVQILHHPDGLAEEALFYGGPEGAPVDHFPGVANE